VIDICKKTIRLGFISTMSAENTKTDQRTARRKEAKPFDVPHLNRRNSILCIIIVAMAIMGCRNGRDRATMVLGDGYRGVIFGEKCSDLKYFEKRYPMKIKFWTPRKKDVVKAEIAIPKFLEENGSEDFDVKYVDEIINNIDSYIRQYCGVIIDKKKYVYCSFIKEYKSNNINADIYKNWENELICIWFIADGGTDYFDILYDVKRNNCKNLYIHE